MWVRWIIENPHHAYNSWLVTDGWEEFVARYNLEVGDHLTFTLKTQRCSAPALFDVTILRGVQQGNPPSNLVANVLIDHPFESLTHLSTDPLANPSISPPTIPQLISNVIP